MHCVRVSDLGARTRQGFNTYDTSIAASDKVIALRPPGKRAQQSRPKDPTNAAR